MNNTFVKKDSIFKALRFVLLARATDESRPAFQMLHVEKGIGQCSDGFRLHKADFNGAIGDGLYEVVKLTKTKIIITKIIDDIKYPDTSAYTNIPSDYDTLHINDYADENYLASYICYAISNKGCFISNDFIYDAIENNTYSIRLHAKCSKNQVYICSPLGVSVIMPLHLGNRAMNEISKFVDKDK